MVYNISLKRSKYLTTVVSILFVYVYAWGCKLKSVEKSGSSAAHAIELEKMGYCRNWQKQLTLSK